MDKLFNQFCNFMKEKRLIENQEIVFLNSGGKDATLGLHFLQEYCYENNLDIDIRVLLVTYPKHVYFDDNGEFTTEFTEYLEYWKSRGIGIEVFVPDSFNINEKTGLNCSICKKYRKEIIDRILDEYNKQGKKVTLFTGYTLYDVMAYVDELLIYTDYMKKTKINDFKKEEERRITNCLHKVLAKEFLPNGNQIIRPLVIFREEDIRNYLIKKGISYVSKPCMVGEVKHKRAYFKSLSILNEITNVTYGGIISFLLNNGIEFPKDFEDIENDQYFVDC